MEKDFQNNNQICLNCALSSVRLRVATSSDLRITLKDDASVFDETKIDQEPEFKKKNKIIIKDNTGHEEEYIIDEQNDNRIRIKKENDFEIGEEEEEIDENSRLEIRNENGEVKLEIQTLEPENY